MSGSSGKIRFQHLFGTVGNRILDLGCHRVWPCWSEMGYNVVGLDSAADMIEQAAWERNASWIELSVCP